LASHHSRSAIPLTAISRPQTSTGLQRLACAFPQPTPVILCAPRREPRSSQGEIRVGSPAHPPIGPHSRCSCVRVAMRRLHLGSQPRWTVQISSRARSRGVCRRSMDSRRSQASRTRGYATICTRCSTPRATRRLRYRSTHSQSHVTCRSVQTPLVVGHSVVDAFGALTMEMPPLRGRGPLHGSPGAVQLHDRPVRRCSD
jgi:hypothetical protein